ncbi:MAG: transcriptional regulator GutM [Treponema sp.]|nr:transcriptional regulator GutM [Treponema sp.]
MSFLQIRRYQKTVRTWLGKGIVGVGQRKGFFRPGELLILVYNRIEDRVVSVQSMRGYTVFANFREVKEYAECSLEKLRRIGIEKDAIEMKWYRKKHPYDPSMLSKKKGALIQAVEAVDNYVRREKEREMEEEE